MVGNCTLASDINKCPYFTAENEGCSNTDKVCGFYRDLECEKNINDIKEAKWFEKYYR